MQRKATLAALAALGLGSAACGSGNSVGGDEDLGFSVKTQHAVRRDAGFGQSEVQVLLADQDFDCSLFDKVNSPQQDEETLLPFQNGMLIVYAAQGVKTYTIAKPTSFSDLPDAGAPAQNTAPAAAEKVTQTGLGSRFATAGTVTVTEESAEKTKGKFDVKTVGLLTVFEGAFGGHFEDNGDVIEADGGRIVAKAMNGEFDVEFCK